MHVPQKSLQSPLPLNETTLPPQHPSHHVAAVPTAGRPYQHSPFATSVAAASHPHHSPFATSTIAAATAAQHQGRLVLQQQVGLITSDCDLVAEARATNASSSSPETWKSFHQLSSKREDQLSNLSQTHPPQQHPHALLAAWEQHQQQQQPGFHQIQLRGMNQVQVQADLQYLTAKRIQAVARQSKGLDAVQSAAVNTEDYLGNSSAPPSTSRHEQLARHSAIAEQMSAIPEQQQQQESVMRSAQQQTLEQTSGGSHLQYVPPPLQPYFKPQLTSASGGPESTRSHPSSSSSQGDTFHMAMKLQAATSNNSLHNPYSSPFQPSPGSHMAEINAENRMKPLNESRNMASSFITPVAQKPGPLSQVQVQARRAPQMQRIISSNKDGGAASSCSASQQYLTPMSSAQAQSALTESHSHQPQSQPSSKGYGFTPQQLLVLKSQIYAFRHLKARFHAYPKKPSFRSLETVGLVAHLILASATNLPGADST